MPQYPPGRGNRAAAGGVAAKQGNLGRAVELCRTGTALLRDLRSGTDPALLEPCLAAVRRRSATHRPAIASVLLARDVRDSGAGAGQRDQPRDRRGGGAAGGQCARPQGGARRSAAARTPTRTLRSSIGSATRWPPARRRAACRPGGAISPADLDKQIADAQAELADADARTAGRGAELRPARAAGGARGRRAGGAGAGRGVRRHRADAAWRLDLPVARRRDRRRTGARAMQPRSPRWSSACGRASNRPPGRCRPSTPQRRRRCTKRRWRRWQRRLAGAKALVVAPSGPLLSLPFAVLLTGPARPNDLAERTVADPPDDDRACAVGRELRCAAQGGKLAGVRIHGSVSADSTR